MIKTRKGEVIVTNEKQNELLGKLYGSAGGRMALKLLTRPFISKMAGAFMDSPLSIPLIKPFIRKNGIDMSEYEKKRYWSYNAFFTRKIKKEMRPVDMSDEALISPCDSKLTVYRIDKNSIFRIKGSRYSLRDLLKNDFLARRYEGGLCMIFRLEVNDYHRYCYIDSGIKTENTHIKGQLHTVNPVALKRYNIYKRNSREYTLIHTYNFGDVVHMEVGAMMVGRIFNLHGSGGICKGVEKGMFEFGGSTIVLLFEKDRVIPDKDILRNSAENIETVVKYGERIGRAL
ncbi:MAG: phosphatidylserine decarboxylase [Ruminococcus sp.]|jgi:phosphatidylserine decarboxylase|nr:phosphatidylserine decarboxylase [Ruminococcus sp.]